jgi:hypothetical protein
MFNRIMNFSQPEEKRNRRDFALEIPLKMEKEAIKILINKIKIINIDKDVRI